MKSKAPSISLAAKIRAANIRSDILFRLQDLACITKGRPDALPETWMVVVLTRQSFLGRIGREMGFTMPNDGVSTGRR